jgi:hypothetical protein
MILTWLEKLNDWLPSHLLPQQHDLVAITSGRVWSMQGHICCSLENK